MRVMRCCFEFSCFVVLRGFLVVPCRVLMMFCCLVMVLCRLLRHKLPPIDLKSYQLRCKSMDRLGFQCD